MLSQLAIGLDEAHRRQLIHRDLKPDNIFLCGTHDGDNVKLLDFGSVKDKSEGAKKLTVMGTTIGSPFYMSPEQAQGLDTLDARADVWALAAITYEAITGRVPFFGNNGPSILLAILTQEPLPASQMAQKQGVDYPIPLALENVIEEALAKNVSIRTASVGELADKVGRAFGLTGSHRQWADMPAAELADAISRTLPSLIQKPAAASPEMLRDPFAAPDPFGRGAQAHENIAQPLARAGINTSDLSAKAVPKKLPIGIIIAAGAVAGVVLVIAIAAIFFR
jgi:serine/threonine-protein kinase